MSARDVWKDPRKGDVVFSWPIGICTVVRASKASVTLRNVVSAMFGSKGTSCRTRGYFSEMGAEDGAEVRHVKECRQGCSTTTQKVNAGTCLPCRRMRAEADGL